jgi:hypothetical protein
MLCGFLILRDKHCLSFKSAILLLLGWGWGVGVDTGRLC